MTFVQPQLTETIEWLVIDSRFGIQFIKLEDIGFTLMDLAAMKFRAEDKDVWWLNTSFELLQDIIECPIDEIDEVTVARKKYDSRFSALD